MSYTGIALIAAAVALVLELTVIRSGLLKKGRFYAAYGIIVFFQFLTNGYLTKTGIVHYDPEAIIGRRIFYAPVEDLFFGFALVLLTMATWTRLGKSERQRAAERAAERMQKAERIAENGD